MTRRRSRVAANARLSVRVMLHFVEFSSPLSLPPVRNPMAATLLPQRESRSAAANSLDFLLKPRRLLEVRFDPNSKTIWCSMRHKNSVSWTLPLLREFNALNADIRALYEFNQFDEPPVKFLVGGSLRPGVFNLAAICPIFSTVGARATRRGCGNTPMPVSKLSTIFIMVSIRPSSPWPCCRETRWAAGWRRR